MAKHSIKGLSLFLVAVLLLSSAIVGISAHGSADTASPVSFFGGLHLPSGASGTTAEDAAGVLKSSATSHYQNLKVYAGGVPFGVKFLTAGVLVIGFNDVSSGKMTVNPARDAGLQAGDRLLSINGSPLTSASDLTDCVGRSEGKALTVRYERNGAEHTTTLKPIWSGAEGRYTTGIYVRDSGAGIGTVTFVLPETGAFGGLGHGICDGETGDLIPMDRGSVVDVTIHGVVRGLAGAPGEVRGYFNAGKIGTLLGNSHCGVWGVFAELPTGLATTPISVGLRNEVKAGKVTIRCTLDGNTCE